MRDITVPIGTPTMRAISAYENSSTSRNQTAWRNASGSASRAACRSASSVWRVSSCSGVWSSRRDVGGLLDRLAVDVHWIAPVVTAQIAERVVENREKPCLEVGAPLELRLGAKRLQIGLLNEVLRIGRPAGQPQCRAIQAVDVRQCLTRESILGVGDGIGGW